jgi:hypothetical protein
MYGCGVSRVTPILPTTDLLTTSLVACLLANLHLVSTFGVVQQVWFHVDPVNEFRDLRYNEASWAVARIGPEQDATDLTPGRLIA